MIIIMDMIKINFDVLNFCLHVHVSSIKMLMKISQIGTKQIIVNTSKHFQETQAPARGSYVPQKIKTHGFSRRTISEYETGTLTCLSSEKHLGKNKNKRLENHITDHDK